ncbi:alpha/beta fold hydrolase [Paraburkholderia sp. HP33-1]|uniref:alpha/beta fold hydrolase n=1 Tax=Paraburkholderia sp. HP33-1 TaxID=2883243 RepID=UPI001F1DF461|nr:alpha/beta fold hydrolase [Paraburkholderia sp. HP33-1]
MPFFTIAGKPLHYQMRGTGYPVLLGHSYLWDSSMWAPQIEALSISYQVIAPDLWGHGQSGPVPENAHTLGDLAAHASGLLDALDIEQCALVGLSVGGMWGAELALREPGRISGLVMMDTYLGTEPDSTRMRYFQMLDTIETLGRIPPPILDAIVPLFFRPGAALDGEVPTAFRNRLSAFSASQLRESIVPLGRLIFSRPDTVPGLVGLDATRTLLMCGALDSTRSPAEMIRMADVIGCRHVLVPEAGHISNLENPAFVTDTLLKWLRHHAGKENH